MCDVLHACDHVSLCVLVSVFTVKNTGICVLSLTLLIAMEEKIGENSSSHDLRDFILKTELIDHFPNLFNHGAFKEFHGKF